MPIAGVICEYNPFHLGHMAHIGAVREALGRDTGIVCVMSGNFVQRGEPALLNKHARARMAVLGGADLVLELPLPWAAASAERFAVGGVGILGDAGVVDYISFGCECPDTARLERAARALSSDSAREIIDRELKRGVSYARARQSAADELLDRDGTILKSPNNTLAVEYLKASDALGLGLRPLPIGRVSVEHDGEVRDGMAPASKIRKLIRAGQEFGSFMPEHALKILKDEMAAGRCPVSLERFWDMTLYRLRTMGEEEYATLPDCGEGLWKRVMRYGRQCASYQELIMGIKTKRYALSRVRRILLAALLGVSAQDQSGTPPYIRVLAFNGRGREILRDMKNKARIPIITKPASAREHQGRVRRIFELEARGTDVYSLLYPSEGERAGGAEWRGGPEIVNEIKE